MSSSDGHSYLAHDREMKKKYQMTAVDVTHGWDTLTRGLDKQTVMLMINLSILAVVVWLLYTFAESYSAMLNIAEKHKQSHDYRRAHDEA